MKYIAIEGTNPAVVSQFTNNLQVRVGAGVIIGNPNASTIEQETSGLSTQEDIISYCNEQDHMRNDIIIPFLNRGEKVLAMRCAYATSEFLFRKFDINVKPMFTPDIIFYLDNARTGDVDTPERVFLRNTALENNITYIVMDSRRPIDTLVETASNLLITK